MQIESEVFYNEKSHKFIFDSEEVNLNELKLLFESQGFKIKFSEGYEKQDSEQVQVKVGLSRKLFLKLMDFFSEKIIVEKFPFFGKHFAVNKLPKEMGGGLVYFACDPDVVDWKKLVKILFEIFIKVIKLRKIQFKTGVFIGVTFGKKTRNNASFGIPSGGWHNYFDDFGEKESQKISKKLIWGVCDFFDLSYIRSDFLKCSPNFLNVFADMVLSGFKPKKKLPVFFFNEKAVSSFASAFGTVSHEIEHFLAETYGWKKKYIQAREKINWDKKIGVLFRKSFYEKNKFTLRATILKWLNKIFYEIVTDANLYLNAKNSTFEYDQSLCKDREKSWEFRMKIFEKFIKRGEEKNDYITYFLFAYYPYLLSIYVVENKIGGEKFKSIENKLIEQSKDIVPGFLRYNEFMKKKSISLYDVFLSGGELVKDVEEVLDEIIIFYFSVNKEQIYSIVKEKIESKQFDCEEIVLLSKIQSLKKKPNHFQFLFERRGKKFYRFTTERIEKAFNDLNKKNIN